MEKHTRICKYCGEEFWDGDLGCSFGDDWCGFCNKKREVEKDGVYRGVYSERKK